MEDGGGGTGREPKGGGRARRGDFNMPKKSAAAVGIFQGTKRVDNA